MLTKSDYICGIQCLRWLWINKNDKERIPELTELDKARFEEGYVIEEYAKQLFPDFSKAFPTFTYSNQGG